MKAAQNATEDEEHHMKVDLSSKLYPAYLLHFAYVPLPIVIATTALTLTYILSISSAIKAKRVSRKCYMLILNRAVGDLLCCAFFSMACFYLITTPQSEFRIRNLRLIGIFCGGCFWSMMISYVSLSVLKLIAVHRPLLYRKTITTERCVFIILFSWIMYAVVVAYSLVMVALSTVPSLKRWSGCQPDTCIQMMFESKKFFFIVLYIFTITVFIATAILVKRAHTQSNLLQGGKGSLKSRLKRSFPLWKLTVSVSTFAVFNFIYIVQIFMFRQDGRKYGLDRRRVHYMGILWTSLVVRILADDIIGLLIDHQIRRDMLRLIGLKSENRSQKADRGKQRSSEISSSTSTACEQRACL